MIKAIFAAIIILCFQANAQKVSETCKMINPDPQLVLIIDKYVNNFAENNVFNQIIKNALKSGETELAMKSIQAAEAEALGSNNISADLFQVMSAADTAKSIKAIGQAKTDMEQYNAIKAATVNVMSTIFPEFAWIFKAASMAQDLNSSVILQKMQEDHFKTMKQIALIQTQINEVEHRKLIADQNAHCLYSNQLQLNLDVIQRFSDSFKDRCLSAVVAVDSDKCLLLVTNWLHFSKQHETILTSIENMTFLTELGNGLKAEYTSEESKELQKQRLIELQKLVNLYEKVKKAYIDFWVAETMKVKLTQPQECQKYALNKSTEIMTVITRYGGIAKVCQDQDVKNDVLNSIHTLNEEAIRQCQYSPLSQNQMLKTIETFLSKNPACAPKEPVFYDK